MILAMLFCVNVPVSVHAEEGYLSSQQMYDWLAAQTGSAIRSENLWQAEHCINDFFPCDWVLGESKESVFWRSSP